MNSRIAMMTLMLSPVAALAGVPDYANWHGANETNTGQRYAAAGGADAACGRADTSGHGAHDCPSGGRYGSCTANPTASFGGRPGNT